MTLQATVALGWAALTLLLTSSRRAHTARHLDILDLDVLFNRHLYIIHRDNRGNIGTNDDYNL